MDERLEGYARWSGSEWVRPLKEHAYALLEKDILSAHAETEELRRELELTKKLHKEEIIRMQLELDKKTHLLLLAHEEKTRLKSALNERDSIIVASPTSWYDSTTQPLK